MSCLHLCLRNALAMFSFRKALSYSGLLIFLLTVLVIVSKHTLGIESALLLYASHMLALTVMAQLILILGALGLWITISLLKLLRG